MQTKWIYRLMTRILGVSLLLVMVINVPSTSMQGLDKVEAAVPMTMSNTGNSSKGLSESTNNTDIQPASITTVSGIVYDAGVEGLDNHGYPLYASIHISATGFDQTIYSDPITGEYSIELVSGNDYTFEVNSVISGYKPLVETVTTTGENLTHNIGLWVDGVACAAPGYIEVVLDDMEGFESGTLPVGWVNYDYIGNGLVWQFDDPGGRGNLTPGGNGGFAIVDSDYYGEYGSQDTGLRTPVMDFSDETSVILKFDTAYRPLYDSATVRVSADNGDTWTDVWSKSTHFVGRVGIDISAQAAGQANVIVEFKYVGSWAWYWEIDDVLITPMDCELTLGGVVAGFVSDANTGDPLIGADVYSDTVATQTMARPDDPSNDGLYWVYQPFELLDQGIESLTGSRVYFDPTAGGDTSFIPGVPGTFCFGAYSSTQDWEYVNNVWVKFPSNWVISNVTLNGTPLCDIGYFGGFSWSWETEPYEINIHHQRNQASSDECEAIYCFTATPGVGPSKAFVSWYWDGDNYGSPPHHPCSNDVYTPASMSDQPCDESVNPRAEVPNGGPGYSQEHDFTALKDLYESETVTVAVREDAITQQDFPLGTGKLTFDPTALEITLARGAAPATRDLTINNIGTSEASFELFEKKQSFPPLAIPPFTGELPEDNRKVSLGPAPEAAANVPAASATKNDLGGILSTAPAFAMDVYPGENLVYIPDTTIPGTWEVVGSISGLSFFAGDFVGGDFSTIYAANYDNNGLYAVDATDGTAILIGTMTPPGGTINGLSGTPDGTMYGIAGDCTTSYLVTVDITSAAVTTIGSIPGVGCGIDLAYDTEDDMIYMVDIITDSLYRVDPKTAAATLVGSLGVNANYAQGMDFEEESGILYWAYYGGGFNGELRTIDTTTGASTSVGAFPSGAEVDCLAFPTGGPIDVLWLSENPKSGVISAGESVDVTLTFDPSMLSQLGDYTARLKVKNNTPYIYDDIRITLHVIDSFKVYVPMIQK